MSDDFAKKIEGDATPPMSSPTGQSISSSITLHPNGRIDFNLFLGNKVMAYGLVETMRAQLDKLYLIAELKEADHAARGGVNGLLKRMQGG